MHAYTSHTSHTHITHHTQMRLSQFAHIAYSVLWYCIKIVLIAQQNTTIDGLKADDLCDQKTENFFAYMAIGCPRAENNRKSISMLLILTKPTVSYVIMAGVYWATNIALIWRCCCDVFSFLWHEWKADDWR